MNSAVPPPAGKIFSGKATFDPRRCAGSVRQRSMGYFPFFVELAGQPGLIVGGGTVALRKVEKLLPYGPRLTVVSPALLPELEAIPGLTLLRRTFSPQDLEEVFFVVAATDDQNLNREISALCRERRIPVNVVDDREACSFLFPALVRHGDLSVGISTGGASPTAAIWLKEQVERLLPERFDEILEWLEGQRSGLKEACPLERQRSRIFAQLFAACLDQGGPLTDEQMRNILQEEESFQ